jgi:hypothetical protein
MVKLLKSHLLSTYFHFFDDCLNCVCRRNDLAVQIFWKLRSTQALPEIPDSFETTEICAQLLSSVERFHL